MANSPLLAGTHCYFQNIIFVPVFVVFDAIWASIFLRVQAGTWKKHHLHVCTARMR